MPQERLLRSRGRGRFRSRFRRPSRASL